MIRRYSCHPGGMAPGGTPQQSFYRAFKLSTFVNPKSAPYFEVDSVFFVVGLAASGSGGGQPINVNLYTTSAIPPTLASLTFVSTTTVTVPDESDIGSTATFSVPPLFNVATDTLVVEIASPDGTMTNNFFAMAFTTASETAPSYVRAPACGTSEPTDTGIYEALFIGATGQTRASTPVTLQSFGVD